MKQPTMSSMFNKDLTPMFDGRVLMNKSAMQDPVLMAVLHDMAKRDFEPLEQPTGGTLWISDRH